MLLIRVERTPASKIDFSLILLVQYVENIMLIQKDKVRVEIKELIDLIRLDEKYASLAADRVLPVDQQALQFHCKRRSRIEEITRKYGLD